MNSEQRTVNNYLAKIEIFLHLKAENLNVGDNINFGNL